MYDVKVIDEYFPEWLVNIVSRDTEQMPVTYTNSPYNTFDRARFFGCMMIEQDKPKDHPPYWFNEYFNRCIYNDILKEYEITNCYRILLNGQLPDMNGCNHNDADSPLSTTNRRKLRIKSMNRKADDPVDPNSHHEELLHRGYVFIFSSD